MGNRIPQQKIDAPKLPSPFAKDGKEDVSTWLKQMELYFAVQQTNISDNQQAIRLEINLSGMQLSGSTIWQEPYL